MTQNGVTDGTAVNTQIVLSVAVTVEDFCMVLMNNSPTLSDFLATFLSLPDIAIRRVVTSSDYYVLVNR